MFSVAQLMFGGTLGEEISANDCGFGDWPRSLFSSIASSKSVVYGLPSAGERPSEAHVDSSGSEPNGGKPKIASMSFETEP